MRDTFRKIWQRQLTAAMAVAFLSSVTAHAQVGSTNETASLSGIIRDTSQTLGKVRLTLTRNGAIRAETATRNDGRFAFKPLTPGDYHFVAQRAGYVRCAGTLTLLWADQSIRIRMTSLADSATQAAKLFQRNSLCSCRRTQPNMLTHIEPVTLLTDSLFLRAPASSRIVVKVVDAEDGQILNRAMVTLSGNEIANDQHSNQFTDVNGFAVFSNLAPGEYRLLTRKAEFDFDARPVVVKSGSTEFRTIQMRWDGDCSLIMIQ
jgi:uncharacterized surface anchored protein